MAKIKSEAEPESDDPVARVRQSREQAAQRRRNNLRGLGGINRRQRKLQ